MWTSDAPILVVVLNKIPSYKKKAVNNSTRRRLVIYNMKKLGKEKLLPEGAIDNKTMPRFISLCAACVYWNVHVLSHIHGYRHVHHFDNCI
ncbi:uncharacterized protein GLRG_11812 [Colletotrichum graminicola M1.001]|uniref:Uncharacterized protein n=1 Tax=Colletotrichum graminicola (strain M1.001 / M2 / FGSC 10212) TaxID=645133 RepID=E3R0M8_COLGM|nr:uncharacterized protein GLRG_11812 [Colletotrichum graminicola M1.001]EFQ36666.1 hypothetical protein GLRG_11812 [Colletotrichum graminicola M1.001]